MPDYLKEDAWKTEEKKHKKVSDTGISGALRDYAKAKNKNDSKSQFEALNKVVKKVEDTKKKYKGDAELEKYLAGILSAAADEKKSLESSGEPDPEAAKELLGHLTAAKTQDRFFAVALGNPPAIVLSKRPVIGAELSAVRKQGGGGHAVTGKCGMEKGRYVFQFEDKPLAGVARAIAKAVRRQSKLTIKVIVRGGGFEIDDDRDEDAVYSDKGGSQAPSGSASEAEQQSPEQAGYETALHETMTILNGMKGITGFDMAVAIKIVAAAKAQAQAGEHAKAAKVLKDLMASAKAQLAKHEATVNQPSGSARQAGEGKGPSREQSEYDAALHETMTILNGMKGVAGFDMEAAVKVIAAAKVAAKDGKLAQAAKVLRELAASAKAKLAQHPVHPDAGLLAAVHKTAEEWRRTWQTAQAGIGELQKTLLMNGDPRAVKIAKTLGNRFKAPVQGVDGALAAVTQALNTGEPAIAEADRLLVAVDTCTTAFAGELAGYIESNPFSVNVELKKPLMASLKKVRELVKA